MPKTPHIAVIVPYVVYPAKMGGQKGIALFYEYLSKLLPVTMLSTGEQIPEHFGGKYISILGESKYRYINPALFVKIKQKLKADAATHLILEHPYFGWLGVLLAKTSGIKLVVHSHNIESLRFKSMHRWWWRILWNYEKFTHRHADINFFITDEDRDYAKTEFELNPAKCHTITYGIEMRERPSAPEKLCARRKLEEMYKIQHDEKILFFNGTLSYLPNLQAVDNIVEHINPMLLKDPNYKYKIIICGKGLPARYNELSKFRSENIIYAGFVDDINMYFKGADIFLNPIIDGGGIKTKLVEALGYNNNVVSTESGAIGVDTRICGRKLLVVPDNDWTAFVNQIVRTETSENIPITFYNNFYWGNIAQKASLIMEKSLTST